VKGKRGNGELTECESQINTIKQQMLYKSLRLTIAILLTYWCLSFLFNSCPKIGCSHDDVKGSDLVPDEALKRAIDSQNKQSWSTL